MPSTVLQRPKWRGFSSAAGLMRELIINGSRDPVVRDFAVSLLRQVPEMFPLHEAEVLHAFVRESIRYTDDPHGEDLYQLPTLTLENGAGDCDDKVILLGSLARSVGFPVRICFVFENARSRFDVMDNEFPVHVYLELDLNKGSGPAKWCPAETIPCPRPNGEYRYLELGQSYPYGFTEYVEV